MKKILGWILVCLILFAVSTAAASGTRIDRLPLELDVPESVPAGEDAVIHWAPEVSGQLLEVYFMSNGNETCLGGFSNECDITIPGHLIAAPGTYHGSAGTYMSDDSIPGSSLNYSLTVTENPNQPSAPSVTLGTAVAGEPISIGFDQAYDEVYMVIMQGGTFCEEHTWTELNDVSVTIDEVGDYSFLFTARTGNVWSQVLTENVSVLPTEITVYDTPDSFQIGEDWNVNVLLPGYGGVVDACLIAQDGSEYCSWNASLTETMNRYTFNMTAGYLIDQRLSAGMYTYRVTWRHDGEEDSEIFPVTVTGEQPVKPVITDGPFSVGEGETIRLTGTAGSADSIRVDWNAQLAVPGNTLGSGSAQIDSNGEWTFEMTPENAGWYRMTITGRNGTLATGENTFWTYVTQVTSPSAPTYSIEQSGYDVIIHLQPGQDYSGDALPYWFVSYKQRESGTYCFQDSFESNEDGSFSFRVYSNGYAGEYDVTVCYYSNLIFSQPATVTVQTQGRPYPVNGPLPIEMTVPETWPAGTDLSVNWTETVEGQEMQVTLLRMNGNAEEYIKDETQTNGGTFRIPGYDLQEGNYKLRISTEAETYWPTQRDYAFEVVTNPNRPAAPTVEMIPSAPNSLDYLYSFRLGQVYEDIYCRMLYWNTANAAWEDWTNTHASSTNFFTCWCGFPAGLCKAEICSGQNGIYSEYAVLEFEVMEPPTLGAIELAQPLPELQINRRFSVTVRPVEHATQYSAVLYRDTVGDNGTESEEIGSAGARFQQGTTENVTLMINEWAENAQPESGYRLYLECRGNGYQSSSLELSDLTASAPSQVPAAPAQLQVCTPQGEALTAEQMQNLIAGSYVPIRVTYPQPMQMVDIRQLRDGRVVKHASEEVDPSRNTWIVNDQIQLEEEGDYTIQARVMSGDLWSSWSEPFAIHANARITVDPVTMTLEKTQMQMGESLNITVGNIDPRIGSVDINVGDYAYYDSFDSPGDTLTITVPEDAFCEGSNRIRLSYSGWLIQEGNISSSVTVTGTRPAGPQVAFSASSARYGETIYATVAAPGATQVEMRVWGEKSYYPVQNGTAIVPIEIDFFIGLSKYYQFRARTDGIWSAWVESGEIRSQTPQPTMDDTEFVVAPTGIVPGEELEITFLPVDGITHYFLSIVQGSLVFHRTYFEPGTVRVPASCFIGGGSYWIELNAGLKDNQGMLSKRIRLSCDPQSDDVLPPLTAEAVDSKLDFGEAGEISLGSLQAEKAIFQSLVQNPALSYGDEWRDAGDWSAQMGTSSSVVTYDFEQESGTRTVRVSARVNGVWTDWSNPVTFTIADRQPDLLHNPVPQTESEIESGQAAHVTWNAAAHAQSYEVCWYGQGGQGSLTTTELYADIPMQNLSAGTWYVYIVSHAAGYRNDGYSERVSLTVTGTPEPVSVLHLPSDLTTIGPEAFVGVGADAVYIPQGVTSIAANAFDAGITIYGMHGSYAQIYAQTYGFAFIEADE
ncbi:MAG: hypothetical protein IJ210_02400 [Clostridia bacterium]|nr:hypothetical protein [Clostridia bacterium]